VDEQELKQFEAQMNQFVDDLGQMLSLLFDDVKQCKVQLETEDSQFGRRVYVRTVFALIEGLTFQMKQIVLKMHDELNLGYPTAELALLKEEAYELNDKGEAYVQSKFLQLPKNVRFAFKVFARTFEVDYQLDVGSDVWASFKDAIEIRNRLTHPKLVNDLHVSDEQMVIVRRVEKWYAVSVHTLLYECLAGPRFQGLDDIES
jgi:hypothetical protein